MNDRLDQVISAIDTANTGDPNMLSVGDRTGPKELVHSEMMTEWVLRLDPDAGAAQLVAARAHHLRRWTHPRSDYPKGRAGYRRWRTAAARAQAEEVSAILADHGFRTDFIDRVAEIVRKVGLGADAVVQTHEDALCLVFLESQLDDIIDSLGEQHATEVVARTVPKMSEAALEYATTLDLSEAGRAVLAGGLDAAKGQFPQ